MLFLFSQYIFIFVLLNGLFLAEKKIIHWTRTYRNINAFPES